MSEKVDAKQIIESLRNDPQALIDLCLQQLQRIDELAKELEAERGRRRELERRVEELEREIKRPAAPFRKPPDKRKQDPKTPGRKKGHPPTTRDKPDRVDQFVEVPLEVCPQCGAPLDGAEPIEQFIEEIPPVRPIVTRLITYRAQCACCKSHVRSRHPLQVSKACGAAGVQLGPRASAFALELTHRHGLTKRKTCRVLKDAFGLNLSPGGLVQLAHRIAGRLTADYDALKQCLAAAPALHVDETSWWVGGPKWWLWVFTDPQGTLYRVAPSRGRDIIRDTIGAQFDGVLISDCLNIYDDVCAKQHKCYSHHLKAISEAIQAHDQNGEGFLQQLKTVLKTAMLIKTIWPQLTDALRRDTRNGLTARARELLSRPRGDPLEEAIRRRLEKQEDHLFTFLDHSAVDATNNLAERQLRPAVIARKLSCGNKTARGARTWEILTSLITTAHQRGDSTVQLIEQAVRPC